MFSLFRSTASLYSLRFVNEQLMQAVVRYVLKRIACFSHIEFVYFFFIVITLAAIHGSELAAVHPQGLLA
jgi:hypothetical protein